jgi:excisionase family DNA binding protein
MIGLRKASAILVLALDDETADTLDASATHACKSMEVFVVDALRHACRRELAMAVRTAGQVGESTTGDPAAAPAAPARSEQVALFPKAPDGIGLRHKRNQYGRDFAEVRREPGDGERLYTVDEAAAIERLGTSTIHREIKRGHLEVWRPTPRTLRIPDSALLKFRTDIRPSIHGRG